MSDLSCKDNNNKPHKYNTEKIKQSASFPVPHYCIQSPFWIFNIFTQLCMNIMHIKPETLFKKEKRQAYQAFSNLHIVSTKAFSSVQDGIYVLGNTLMRSSPSLRNVLNTASETVPMFVWLPIAQACKHAQTHIIFCQTYKSVVKVTHMLSAVTCTVNSLPVQTRLVLQQGYHW